MKNWNLLFRRTHLYLGMMMLPWMAMYALSTGVFNHGEAFGVRRASTAPWLLLWEKDYAIEIPAGTDGLRDTVRRLLTDNSLSGDYQINKRCSLNTNIRNVFNAYLVNTRYGSVTPGYAQPRQYRHFGVYFSAGIKGTF